MSEHVCVCVRVFPWAQGMRRGVCDRVVPLRPRPTTPPPRSEFGCGAVQPPLILRCSCRAALHVCCISTPPCVQYDGGHFEMRHWRAHAVGWLEVRRAQRRVFPEFRVEPRRRRPPKTSVRAISNKFGATSFQLERDTSLKIAIDQQWPRRASTSDIVMDRDGPGCASRLPLDRDHITSAPKRSIFRDWDGGTAEFLHPTPVSAASHK